MKMFSDYSCSKKLLLTTDVKNSIPKPASNLKIVQVRHAKEKAIFCNLFSNSVNNRLMFYFQK